MPRKSKSAEVPSKTSASATQDSSIEYPLFPTISEKHELQCTELVEDQVLLIDDFLSPEECKAFVSFIEKLPLEPTPPKKRGEAERVNHRLSIQSPEFAQRLFVLLSPHLPTLPLPASFKRKANISTEPHSMNSNIRLYRYTEGQHFGPHYDDSVKDPVTGALSEWTLLIYLTGGGQGVVGGQTVFYREKRGQPTEEIVAPLTRGTALLHRHGHECMLHEGKSVLKGTKYILRSDLMFKR